MACVKDNGKIIVGITDYAPMDYKENGKWIGFDAELAEMFAEELGVECIDGFDIEAAIHEDDNVEEEKQLTHGELVKKVNSIGKKLYKDYQSDVIAITERYLGEGVKVSKTTEAQNDKLQFIINDLTDFAEKVNSAKKTQKE